MTKVQDTCATCILKMVLSRESQINDAHQVPIATISKADMIVSWNLSICSLWQNAFFQRNKQKGRLSVYPNLFAFGGRIIKKTRKMIAWNWKTDFSRLFYVQYKNLTDEEGERRTFTKLADSNSPIAQFWKQASLKVADGSPSLKLKRNDFRFWRLN